MGNPVKVFAYYSAPKGETPEGGWPAVVCIHGGGGTAFADWVKIWNDHGFAAISMDLEGHFPNEKSKEKQKRIQTPNPGPERVGVFNDYEKPIEDQWYYHAVSQVILAHSLIRSFPEVNADKIGVTGISWGGTLTSTVIGVDNRFAFAIPVYGCGFLPNSDGNQGESIKPGKHTEIVSKYYDGSAYFDNVTIPTLWVNGTNDHHFPLPCTLKSSQAVKGDASLRFEVRMKHGHRVGWAPEIIYAFAKSVVCEGQPILKFSKPILRDKYVEVTFSNKTVAEAQLLYTTDTGVWNKRYWNATDATVLKNKLSVELPEGTIALFFNVTDSDNLLLSTEIVEVQ
jgi:dienelactone hydrolase